MFFKDKRKYIFVTVIYLLFYSCFSYADISLKFGLYSSDKASDMVRKFRPVLNFLELKLTELLGDTVVIRIKVASSYGKGIDNLVNGKVDFARFGPASYILSKQRNQKIKIIVIEKNKKVKKISGAIVTQINSKINSLGDLTGKSFAFGNKDSTTGRYFSQYRLYENGIKANKLSKYNYLGRHDRVAAAVFSGQYDAGSFKISTLNKFLKKGRKFKILTTFPTIYKPWLAKEQLDEKTFNAMQLALIHLKNKQILSKLEHAGFALGSESDFKHVKQVIEKNHLFFKQ
ncbi:MAG: PhnD/SsuA/transferrin family substrate-binding protein [Pseudomonadota bacterium]